MSERPVRVRKSGGRWVVRRRAWCGHWSLYGEYDSWERALIHADFITRLWYTRYSWEVES